MREIEECVFLCVREREKPCALQDRARVNRTETVCEFTCV